LDIVQPIAHPVKRQARRFVSIAEQWRVVAVNTPGAYRLNALRSQRSRWAGHLHRIEGGTVKAFTRPAGHDRQEDAA